MPWAQALLPWRLLAIGPAAMVALGLLIAPLLKAVGRVSGHDPVAMLTISAAMAGIWLVYFIGPFAAMAYGIRIGARPSHCRIAVFGPSALMILAYLVVWIVRAEADWIAEAIGASSYLAVSSLFARVATAAGAHIARLRLALLLVVITNGTVFASISRLPDDVTRYAPSFGMVLAMLALVAFLPRRRADPVPA